MRKNLSVLFILFLGSLLFGAGRMDHESIMPFQNLDLSNRQNLLLVSNTVNVDDVSDSFYMLTKIPLSEKLFQVPVAEIEDAQNDEEISPTLEAFTLLGYLGLFMILLDPNTPYPREERKVKAEDRLEALGF